MFEIVKSLAGWLYPREERESNLIDKQRRKLKAYIGGGVGSKGVVTLKALLKM